MVTSLYVLRLVCIFSWYAESGIRFMMVVRASERLALPSALDEIKMSMLYTSPTAKWVVLKSLRWNSLGLKMICFSPSKMSRRNSLDKIPSTGMQPNSSTATFCTMSVKSKLVLLGRSVRSAASAATYAAWITSACLPVTGFSLLAPTTTVCPIMAGNPST